MKKTQYKVSDFLSWQKQKTLDLSPSFQRRPVWKPGAKSYLIDTIIRGLPIPIIFIREKRSSLESFEPKREIVDGQQRLRTLITFISPSFLPSYKKETDFFILKKTHNKDLGDKTYNDLPNDIKQRILDYEFSVHVLPAEVDDREVLEIFARMNATGVKLNDQELRNAEFYGEFKTTCYDLATEQLNRWRDWNIFSEYNISRMEEVELTSELLMLIVDGIRGKSPSSITTFYKNHDDLFSNKNIVASRFRHIFNELDGKLGSSMKNMAFRKRSLFYPLFAFAYDICFNLSSKLESKQGSSLSSSFVANIKKADYELSNSKAPEKVLQAISRRTTHHESRKNILEYLQSL